MKYIIKNCPALYSDEYCKEYIYEDGSVFCKDRTDCLPKQVISKCNYHVNKIKLDIMYKHGGDYVAGDILSLFEVEEVEE